MQTAGILNELVVKNNPVFLVYNATCDQYFKEQGGFLFVSGQGNIKLPSQKVTTNLSFEHELAGWNIQGDVRVLNSLGGLSPTQGNKMGFISTGTGYNNALGSLSQDIFIPFI